MLILWDGLHIDLQLPAWTDQGGNSLSLVQIRLNKPFRKQL